MTSIVRTRISASAGVLGLVLVTAACSTSTNNHAAPTASSSPTVAAAQAATLQAGLRTDLRKLWEDHITWTRLYIIAAEAGAPDTDATAGRLLQNQTDIGNALKPLYGDAAGAQLTALLKQHILTAGALIGAAKAGDTAKVTSTKAQWYANGDQIAAFLTKANPTSWPAAQMRQMMRDHLDNTLAEAVDHLQGHAAADIADYDKVHVQILQMADMLTTGIVAQFPDKFGAPVTPSKAAALGVDMRKLWEDHITWTRLYIIAAEAGAPDTDATAGRLLQNQTDIGNALKPLYGDAAGAQLTALLKQHILTAGALIAAAKAGDTAKVTSTKAQWYANGDQIAAFLTKANPTSWPAAQMRQMMRDHLDNTLAEAVDHLQGHAAADIADYDKVHVQILQMADMLTTGIVTQFPQQFS